MRNLHFPGRSNVLGTNGMAALEAEKFLAE